MGPGSRPGRRLELFHHPDLAEILQHAGMDQLRNRRRSHRVRGCRLAGLRQFLAERAFDAVQRTRQMIGDIIRQAFAHQDKTPRPQRIDWRILVRIAAGRNRQRLEECMFRPDARDLFAIRRDDPRTAGARRHGGKSGPADAGAPQRRGASVEHHRRAVTAAVEIDGLKILVLLQAETVEHVTRQDRKARAFGPERDRFADEVANGLVWAVGAHHEHTRARIHRGQDFQFCARPPDPHKSFVGRLSGDQRDIELAGLQQRNILVAAFGVARLDRQRLIGFVHDPGKGNNKNIKNKNMTGEIMIASLRTMLLGLVCLTSLVAGMTPSSAADYPNRPVRWLIGFAAGGPVDIVARIMSQWLSEHFGQQFVVENRAGSGGNLAAAAAVTSPPDGYTLLFVAPNNAISTSLYKKLPYDFIRDTVPVASIMQLTNMMVVPTSLPVKTLQEFIDYCKANPGKVAFASSGNGTSVHMSAELFKALTKVEMTHVPYRGSSAAMPDLISNKVQVLFDNLPSALEQVRGGTLRGLGVTSPNRWPGVPDIPAVVETVPGFESVGFYGISAPKGTPPEIVDILNKAVGEALKDPKLVARLGEVGGIPKPMTPAEFGKLVADETDKWRKVVEFAGVSVD